MFRLRTVIPRGVSYTLLAAAIAFPTAAQEQPARTEEPAKQESEPPQAREGQSGEKPSTARVDEMIMVVGSAENLELIGGSADRLEGAELLRAQAGFADIHRILRSVPGVNIQEEDGYGLRPNIGMRGSGGERSANITLMEDGVLISPAPYAAPSAYYFPTAARMEAVEVRKGSSQIKFGPRTNGGALNLVSTRVPDANLDLLANVGGGNNATARGRLTVGGNSGRWGWMLETYQIRTDGFKQVDGGGDAGFRLSDYLGKMRYRSVGRGTSFHEIEAKVGYTDQVSDETYLGLTDLDFAAQPNRRYAASQHDQIDLEHSQVQLRHYGVLSAAVDVTTVVYRNDFRRDWYKLQSVAGASLSSVLDTPDVYADELAILRGAESTPDALKQRHNNRSYFGEGIQTVVGLHTGGAATSHDLEVGVRYHVDREDRFQSEDGYQMIGGQKLLTSVGAPGSQSNRVSDARAWALFAQDRAVLGKLGITPGLRFETIGMTRTDYEKDDPDRSAASRVRDSRVNVLVPGIGLDYRVGDDGMLFAGVHRGFAPPAPGAAAEVEAETSVNYELGGRYRGLGGAFSAAGFFNGYVNLLGNDTLSGGGQGTGDQFNGGKARVWGAEVSGTWNIAPAQASVGVPVSLGYTWTRGEFLSSFESDYEPWGEVEAGDEIPYLPEHQVHISGGVQGSAWDAYATLTAGSAMRTVAGRGPIELGTGTEAFAVVDLTAGWNLGTDTRLNATLQNVFDVAHVAARRPAGVRPGLSRTIAVGVTYQR